MNSYLTEDFETKKNDEDYVKLLYKCYKNLYDKTPTDKCMEYDNENNIHYYSKEILKGWLKKMYPNDCYIQLEYPITKSSVKKDIIKKYGLNPTMSDVYYLLNEVMISRVDVVVFNSDNVPIAYYEVVNTSACKPEKIEKMKNLNVKDLYEIEANYIINCKKNRLPPKEKLEANLKKLL